MTRTLNLALFLGHPIYLQQKENRVEQNQKHKRERKKFLFYSIFSVCIERIVHFNKLTAVATGSII